MKYLILLNRKFPYKSGETFLENEVREISKKFDQILIYPSDICEADEVTRNINANNISVRIVEEKSLKYRKISYLLKSPFFMNKGSANGFRRKCIEGYFLAAAEEQKDKIIKDLDNIEFTGKDQIYIYSYWFYINAKVACLLKEYFISKGIKTVAFSRAHRFDIYENKRKFSYIPQRIEMLKTIDKVYPCSDDGTEYIKSHYAEYSEKITTSYLGTYDHGIGKNESRKKFKIVSCSRMSEVKRIHLIIEALKILKNKGISLEWTHLGGGELYEEIVKKSSELDWMDVNLVGAISNTEVYEHYLNVPEHVFINVSSSEGLPVSIMEAISFGIPTIATNVGGTSEIVVDNVSGFLLEPDCKGEELANLILKVIDMQSEQYDNLRKSTRKYWEDHFQAKKNYEDFSNMVLSIK